MSENIDKKNKMSKSSAVPKPSMLRPSVFGSNIKLSEIKCSKVDDIEKSSLVNNETIENDQQDVINSEDKKEKTDGTSMLAKNGIPKFKLFPISKDPIQSVECSSFIFGQNVHERVVGENLQTSENDVNLEVNKPIDNALLFSSMAKTNSAPLSKDKKEESKSLTEVAQEYEESRAKKRKYEEVETFTGEENEVNIIDLNCKLFAFVNRNWEERGRGSLRLNDSKDGSSCSRVVFRTSGNLRLLLNTKVWSGMVVEKANSKSLRLTAMDNLGQVKVFLIMSRPDDITGLYNALMQRIQERKNPDAQTKVDESNKKEEDILAEPSPKKTAACS